MEFPKPQFNIKKEGGQPYIFDSIRKAWLVLTDEEWVRQNMVAYLVKQLNYPAACIALEKELLLHDQKKRFDMLVYTTTFKPWMMIECKATGIKLSEETLQQVLRYNITLPVDYFVITNGEATVCWKKEGNSLVVMDRLPAYEEA